MIRYIIKRLLYGILVLWGVITIVFFLFNILPGDAAQMLMGQRSDVSSVEAIKKELGLDKPLATQYLNFLNDISVISFHDADDPDNFWYFNRDKYTSAAKLFTIGHTVVVAKKPYLRQSYQSKRDVTSIIAEAFPKTLVLATASIVLAMILGVLFGIMAATYKDSTFH